MPVWHLWSASLWFLPQTCLNYLCNGLSGCNYFSILNSATIQLQALKFDNILTCLQSIRFAFCRGHVRVSQTVLSCGLGVSMVKTQFWNERLDMTTYFGFWIYRQGETVLEILQLARVFMVIPFNFVHVYVALPCYASAMTILQYAFLQWFFLNSHPYVKEKGRNGWGRLRGIYFF